MQHARMLGFKHANAHARAHFKHTAMVVEFLVIFTVFGQLLALWSLNACVCVYVRE